MAEYQVEFFRKADGECPTKKFLDKLSEKIAGKISVWIEELEKQGPDLPRPYADKLDSKIRELRIQFGTNHYRLLYFFHGKRIIITHGFLKKTWRVPRGEIELAKKCMKEFLQR